MRAVVDSTGLNPTASREALVADAELDRTRERVGAAIRGWVLELARSAPHRLELFVGIHELSLKSLVRYDEELARLIVPFLSLETSLGRISVARLTRDHRRIRYAETLDEYRQIVGIADPATPLVNGGYVFDAEVVRLLPVLVEGVEVERADLRDELARLDPPPADDRPAAAGLERRASAVLAAVDCVAVVREIDDASIPALHIVDRETLWAIDRSRTRELGARGSALWGDVLGRLDEQLAEHGAQADGARLCLNWRNPAVRALATAKDGPAFERTVRLVYLQALLTGQRALGPADRALMTATLTDLVREGADASDPGGADAGVQGSP